MDDIEVFTNLLGRIGFTLARQRNAIMENGFSTCRELASFDKDSLDELFTTIQRLNRDLAENARVKISLTMKKRLNAVREEFIMRDRCDAEMVQETIDALTTVEVDTLAKKHMQWNESKKSASNDQLPDVDVPKLTKSNWKDFRTAIHELLSRKNGVNEISLSYITREDPEGDYDEELHDSTETLLISCMALHGPKYSQDKQSVYSLLVQHAKGTEVESIVEKYSKSRDGRKTWLAILKHMESTSYMDNLKSNALASMKRAQYKGEKRGFTISDYYTVHSIAHNDLSTAGDPLSHGMKITNFMQGLKEPTAINYAVTTKNEVGYEATFDTFYNSFSAKLNSHLTLMKDNNDSSKRNISAFGSGRGGKGGRGRGMFGRGRGYRGGRGRGRGRGRSGRWNTRNEWTPKISSYSNDEWNNLSQEQKNRVYDLRNYVESQNLNSEGERKIKATSTNNDESSNTFSDNQNEVTLGRAGDAFAPRTKKSKKSE